ncbi:MAG: T9SS type A sorting domain-containing protein, partial [Gemmatimonadetes bacterium]|nr:T9SS type A sorting domain-containing protein [Gemmatimonadota bacterium]
MVVDVHDCTTVGAGDIAYTAQNGIQVSYGAAGTVTDCDISAVRYTPATFVASGLLTYLCGGPVVTSGNVVISDCQAPVSWYDTDGTLGGLEIASGGEFDAVFLYNDTVVRSAERPLPVPFEESMPTGRAPVTFAVAVTNGCLTGSAVALSSGIDIYSASSALNVVVTNMTITNWDYGIYVYGAGANCVANDNSIAGNLTAGLDNSASGNPVDAERNWWGAADGPSGAGSGSGDAVNDTGFPGSVDFDPYRIDGSSTTVCAFTPVDNTVSPNPSPLDCISGPTPCVTVPFEIMRTDSDGMRGYSVNFTLSPELELCAGTSSVVQGSYLNSINPLTAFQVLDNGGGSYTVDCSILGIPCGQTAPTGTLFTVGVKASGGDGTGTITVDSVIARDCANVPIPCSPGAPASILIDATGPVAVGDLAAMQKTTGNTAGNDTTGIFVNFTAPGDADVVEVWAAPYGNYPEYDDAPGAGSVPAIPSYPPSAPWILTSATTTGDTVHLAARDFWYFTMFTKDECGNVSAVSNMTSGTLNYHLGDVTDGSTNGHGDNGVGFLDVSLLGANYGITLGVSDPLGYLDVGPTSDFSVNGLPDTDNQVQFEDLMMFAINYGLVSAPARAPQPSEAVLTEPFVSMTYRHENGHTFATLRLEDNVSQVKGVHALLDGGGAAVISATPTGIAQPGSVFLGTIPQESGTFVDLAVLGTDAVFAGSGEIAVVELDGLVRPAIRTVDLRNRANRSPNHPRTEEPDAADDGTTDAVTDVQVSSVQLVGARPNPFDGSTRIAFRLPAATPVTVRIHDVAGRLVRTLVDRPVAAGETSVVWDGRSDDGRVVGAGIYFYTLTAAEHRETRKLLRVR